MWVLMEQGLAAVTNIGERCGEHVLLLILVTAWTSCSEVGHQTSCRQQPVDMWPLRRPAQQLETHTTPSGESVQATIQCNGANGTYATFFGTGRLFGIKYGVDSGSWLSSHGLTIVGWHTVRPRRGEAEGALFSNIQRA